VDDPSSMYLIGRFASYASVIKFSKRSFNLDWKTEVRDYTGADQTALDLALTNYDTKMSEILTVVQPPNKNFMFCGGYSYRDNDNPNQRIAVIMKIDDDGDIKFVKQFGKIDHVAG